MFLKREKYISSIFIHINDTVFIYRLLYILF